MNPPGELLGNLGGAVQGPGHSVTGLTGVQTGLDFTGGAGTAGTETEGVKSGQGDIPEKSQQGGGQNLEVRGGDGQPDRGLGVDMEPVYLLGPVGGGGLRRSSRLHNKGATKHKDCTGCLSIKEKGGVKGRDRGEVKYYFACQNALKANAESEIEAYRVEKGEEVDVGAKVMQVDPRLRESVDLVTVWREPRGVIRVLIHNKTSVIINVRKGQALLTAFNSD